MDVVLILQRRRRRPLKAARAQGDYGRELIELLAKELVRRLTEGAGSMTASELEVVRKLLSDNTITLTSIRRGDFGELAQEVLEEYPFGDNEVANEAPGG